MFYEYSHYDEQPCKIRKNLNLLYGYSLVIRWLLVAIKHSQALVLNKSGVLHRMRLIGHARF